MQIHTNSIYKHNCPILALQFPSEFYSQKFYYYHLAKLSIEKKHESGLITPGIATTFHYPFTLSFSESFKV